jgi:transposase-like protein
MKHSIEERLLAVKKCLAGHAPFAVGREMGINEHHVSEWLLRYQQEGIDGLQKRPPKRADFAEKCKIICEYAEKGVPLHRICAKYHVGLTTVQRWARIYRQGGYAALRAITAPGTGRKGMGRPKKKEPQTELERLRYENEYLRAEVALLKKVRALMEEKEKRLHAIGRKPSKH